MVQVTHGRGPWYTTGGVLFWTICFVAMLFAGLAIVALALLVLPIIYLTIWLWETKPDEWWLIASGIYVAVVAVVWILALLI